MFMKQFFYPIVFAASFLFFSCQDAEIVTDSPQNTLTRAIVPESFDWDTADYMPTPPTQVIPVPWIGQGSIAPYYGLDVVNDHKHSDGWELVYNSFRSSGPNLNDPYFILYNKYRGLLQLYVYVTNQTVLPSNNVLAEISMLGAEETTMFNFLGTTIVDPDRKFKSYDMLMPSLGTNGVQFAPNKWYMVQYELAYDPSIENLPYEEVHLDFNMQFVATKDIYINGESVGTIEGTIGGQGGGILPKLVDLGKSGVQAAIGFVGKNAAEKLSDDSETGNKLHINKNVWGTIQKGVSSVLSGGTSNTLKAAVNVLNGLIFGTSNSVQSVNLTFESKITLTGEMKSKGSFPSMPIDLWMPGTGIPTNAQQYVPLYNRPMGVFNLLKRPEIKIMHHEDIYEGMDDSRFEPTWAMQKYSSEYVSDNTDFRQFVQINPDVLSIADVDIEYDLLFLEKSGYLCHATEYTSYDTTISGDNPSAAIPDYDVLIRYRIKIIPKDKNVNQSLIVKTFLMKKKIKTDIVHHSM